MMSIKEAAGYLGITPAGVRASIRNGRLKSQRLLRRICISKDDLIDFRENRWKNRERKFKKGELSPHMAADLLGIPVQRIYYLLRKKLIPSFRQGKATITILQKDILRMVDEKKRIAPKKQRAS